MCVSVCVLICTLRLSMSLLCLFGSRTFSCGCFYLCTCVKPGERVVSATSPGVRRKTMSYHHYVWCGSCRGTGKIKDGCCSLEECGHGEIATVRTTTSVVRVAFQPLRSGLDSTRRQLAEAAQRGAWWCYLCDAEAAFCYRLDCCGFCACGRCVERMDACPGCGSDKVDEFEPISPRVVTMSESLWCYAVIRAHQAGQELFPRA